MALFGATADNFYRFLAIMQFLRVLDDYAGVYGFSRYAIFMGLLSSIHLVKVLEPIPHEPVVHVLPPL